MGSQLDKLACNTYCSYKLKVIMSQAAQGCVEGATTSLYNLDQMMGDHERLTRVKYTR